ncbi:MAG TPA: hypothetical protein VMC80_02615 [Patescibacteria group bacterium]|nr:hypothetical protein [Patescibacteria group bacterium]
MIDEPDSEYGKESPVNDDWILKHLCNAKELNSIGDSLQKRVCESNGHPHSKVQFYNPFMNLVLIVCKTCGVTYRKPTETEMKIYAEFLTGFNGTGW